MGGRDGELSVETVAVADTCSERHTTKGGDCLTSKHDWSQDPPTHTWAGPKIHLAGPNCARTMASGQLCALILLGSKSAPVRV